MKALMQIRRLFGAEDCAFDHCKNMRHHITTFSEAIQIYASATAWLSAMSLASGRQCQPNIQDMPNECNVSFHIVKCHCALESLTY